MAVFPSERDILLIEISDHSYSLEPAFLAYNFIEIPVEIISAILFTVFTMVVVGLNTNATSFFSMAFSVFVLTNVGESIGIMFCSLVHHVGFSVSITNAVLGIFVVMSGFMSANMPVFLDRINRISPVSYVGRLMGINEFSETVMFSCSSEEVAQNLCWYQTGSDVLNILAVEGTNTFRYDQFWVYLGTAAGLLVIYRLLAYGILKMKTKT